MARQRHHQKNSNSLQPSLERVFTGGDKKERHLVYALQEAFQNAKSITLAVSFLMESGVTMMLPYFEEAAKHNVPIRILCGSYLNITQPSALSLLFSTLPDADLRFYNNPYRSFHPKAYMFEMEDHREMFIGSSNFSHSALTSGIEWNYRIADQTDQKAINDFLEEFNDLFEHHAIRLDQKAIASYSQHWKQPKVYLDLELQKRKNEVPDSFEKEFFPPAKKEEVPKDQTETSNPADLPGTPNLSDSIGPEAQTDQSYIEGPSDLTGPVSSADIFRNHSPAVSLSKSDSISITPASSVFPRGPQIEALLALEQTRKEGANKALVQAATGVGKTYLAAFDSRGFERVLFVAHRQEILKQAADSFAKVRPGDSIGFFQADQKDTDAKLLFASVQTLGKKENLRQYFRQDSFDYMVIDEFHHAAASSYQNLLNYFKPKFLLGLTATPDRMDGRNIYEICDYNVPFQMDLQKAINQGVLSPFHYYGIYDKTDYDQVEYKQGKYVSESLLKAYQNNPERNDLIFKHYLKHQGKRALGFCSSKKHALLMARDFEERGIKSGVLVSEKEADSLYLNRQEALSRLESGDLEVLFCVDMLNEGVDIPAIDMVMFLRPTESSIIFMQQLGRGLRKADGKSFLTVLDFIGNYKNAGRVSSLLSGLSAASLQPRYTEAHLPLPEGCFADFDIKLLDLFDHLRKQKLGKRQTIFQEYQRIEEMLGHVPSRMDLFTYMDDEIYTLCMKSGPENPFRNYLEYRKIHHDLSEDLEKLYNSRAREFLNLIETTSMTRVYKMPVLMTFVQDGIIHPKLTEEDLLKTWKEFFASAGNWRDLPDTSSYEEYLKTKDKDHLKKILSNPVNFLIKSGNGFFAKEDGFPIVLNEELFPYLENEAFIQEFEDIIRQRQMDYYRRRFAASQSEEQAFAA